MKATLDKEAIKIAYAAATPDYKRPVLQYVLIGSGKIVAADGYMLAMRAILTEPEKGDTILVEAKALLQAHRILGGDELVIESNDDEKTATIKSNNEKHNALTIDISTNLLDAKFPGYTQVIPKDTRKAYVALQTNLLSKIIKTVGADSGKGIKIKVREPTDTVEIHCKGTDIYVMPYYTPEEEETQ